MSLLALEGVRKSFGKNVVLQDIDLTVERGQCVVLIGASGSGKSTLLRCVNLLEVVDDGRITLDGDDITDPRIDADAVRARMGGSSGWPSPARSSTTRPSCCSTR